jgi:ABC-type antimicrobial peptide transport system permease subunit
MENYTEKPQRSQFLTILCILTFIGSGYGIISGITSLSIGPKMMSGVKAEQKRAMEEAKHKNQDIEDTTESRLARKMMGSAQEFMDPEKMKQSGMATIAANLLTFAGAFFMFRQSRKGFYLYVAGSIAGTAAPLIIFKGNMLATFSALFPGFVGIVFIVMYAFCLKEMEP